jgi:hypothetical protein
MRNYAGISHFRVTRMENIEILPQPRAQAALLEKFDLAGYAGKAFLEM